MNSLRLILALLYFLSLSFFPISVDARGGGRSHTGRSSRSRGSHITGSGTEGHPKTYCQTCARNSRGRIERSSSEKQKFLKSKGLTHTPPGYQVDHIIALSKGGADKTYNMQLIPKNSPKERNELK